MKSGIRLSHTANFEGLLHADKYMATGLGLTMAVLERGFTLTDMTSDAKGIGSSYAYSISEQPERLSREKLSELALNALKGNAEYGSARTQNPVGMFVTLTLYQGGDALEAKLLQLGHMELMKILTSNGFVPMHADGTTKDTLVLTFGLNFETPLVYSQETHDKIAAAMFGRKERTATVANMIFQNVDIHFAPGRNTFRLGTKWFDTLKVGDVVRATNGAGEQLGFLRVASLKRDFLNNALDADALNNHGVREMSIDNKEEAVEYLIHVLQTVYPKTELTNDTVVTVIGFEPKFVDVEVEAQVIGAKTRFA